MASTAEQETTPAPPLSTSFFEQLDSYNWDADSEFQTGLSAILSSAASAEQKEELSLRARCFYFARKYGTAVDFEQYKTWRAHQTSHSDSIEEKLPWQTNGNVTTTSTNDDSDAGPKLSYQEIVDLIQNGKPVPGIKEIPSTVLAGQGTTATKERRRKPWEKDAPSVTETTAPAEAAVEPNA